MEGGKFYILDYDNNPETKYDRSNITANNKDYEFKFLANSGAEFEMRNSELSECGYTVVGEDDGRRGLIIKTDNTIIDNSSFYNNYYGIFLKSSSNNQIINNTVYSNYYHGIYFYSSNNNKIINNFVSNNIYGIKLEASYNNQISNNNVSDNDNGIYLVQSKNNEVMKNNVFSNELFGIYISSSINNKLRDNIITNNTYNLEIRSSDLSNYYNDIDISNLINGKKVYYIKNESNLLFDNSKEIGFLGLISCSIVTVNNLNMSNNGQGILFTNVTDSQIKNCKIKNNYYGIYLFMSNNISVDKNNISINSYGIYQRDSSSNLILYNSFYNNSKNGIFLRKSINCSIKNNNINHNLHGISLDLSCNNTLVSNNNLSYNRNGIFHTDSTNSTIINNQVSSNYEYGIRITHSRYIQILRNNITNNTNNGVYLYWISYSQFIENYIFSNNGYGVFFSHSNDNKIINNTLLKNKIGIFLDDRNNNNKIINSTISENTEFDFYLKEYSNIIAINTTFEKNKVFIEDEKSEFLVQWYLNVKVVNEDNLPLPYSRVIIENIKGERIFDDIIGIDGKVKWLICNEYVQNQFGLTNYTKHTITAEKDDFQINKIEVKMNESKFIILGPKLYNIILECEESKKSVNPKELVIYIIKITNKGAKTDKISLEVINQGNWLAYLNSYHAFLLPNENKTVILTIISPEDEKEGIISTIQVKATSRGNTSVQDFVIIKTTINFVHSIEISQNILEGSIDPGKNIKYEIQLENLGNGDEEINLIINNSQSDEQGGWGVLIETGLEPLEIEIGKLDTTSVRITPPLNAAANEQLKIVFDIFSGDIFLDSITTITTVNQTHHINIECDENEKSGKPSEIVNYVLNLTNNGNGEETFLLELSGENIDLCDLSDTYISLNSNNYTDIYLDVLIPNNAKAWEKADITISVLSLDRTQKYSSMNILTNVSQIFDLKIETENKEIFVESGTDFEFDVNIENLGNGVDNITLSISGIPTNWEIDLPTINTLIDSESSFTKSIKLSIPETALASEMATLVFTIKSNNFGDFILDYMNLTVYVNQNYEIELKCTNPSKEVIIGESVEYKIEVENKGNGKDTIILKFSGLNSDWAYLSESVAVLEAGESKDISLFIKPPANVKVGENALISIIGVSKNKIYSNPLTITTELKGIENNPPTADFKLMYENKEVTKVKIGEEITFDASSSTDEEAEIVEYRWNFSNGDVRYGEKVDYIYPKDTEPGEYTITLKVTDSNGATTEKQLTIEVLEEEEEGNWLMYLILVVVVVIGILIVIMLQKVNKNLKELEKERKSVLLTSEKVGVTSIEEERRKEEQKRKEMEMWKPVEGKNEVFHSELPKVAKERGNNVSEVRAIPRMAKEGMAEPLTNVEEEKLGEREELVEEEKVEEIEEGKNGEFKVGEKEENTTNKKKDSDDFWDNFKNEGEI